VCIDFTDHFRIVALWQNSEAQRVERRRRAADLMDAAARKGSTAEDGAIGGHFQFPMGGREGVWSERLPCASGFGERAAGLVELLAEDAELNFHGGGFLNLGRISGDFHAGKIVVLIEVLGVVEKRDELIELLVVDGIIRMRVALHAAESGGLPGGPSGAGTVDHGGDPELLVSGAALGIGLGVAMESGGEASKRSATAARAAAGSVARAF
jgi:hypothetical protein